MHLDAGPSLHSISIGPASAANAGGFLQVVESKARTYATLCARLPPRASDSTLRLLARNNFRLARHSLGIATKWHGAFPRSVSGVTKEEWRTNKRAFRSSSRVLSDQFKSGQRRVPGT